MSHVTHPRCMDESCPTPKVMAGRVSNVFVVVCCSVLQRFAACCSVLQCVAVCCIVMQCVAVFLQCVAVCCSMLYCDAVCCSVFAVCCSVLYCIAVCCGVLAVCCSVLQCVAVCCSVLQCVAVCCSVLRCVAVCRSVSQCFGSMLQYFCSQGVQCAHACVFTLLQACHICGYVGLFCRFLEMHTNHSCLTPMVLANSLSIIMNV